MCMLQVQNITYEYDESFRIDNVSFELQKGETLAIVGPSGSGKSTLLKIILGSIQPHQGAIVLNGTEVTSLDIDKRNIGYCPQDQLLFPHLNVFDNIAIGLKAKKMPKEEVKKQVESLANISEITPLLKRKTNQISGGQKQRVSILRAIANSPNLLLLDEPFHNLDAQIKDQIVTYVKKVQSLLDIAIIFVTHDINEAKLLADKILILINGSMKQVGTAKQLTTSPNSFDVANAMGLPNIFTVRQFNKEKKLLDLDFGQLFLTDLGYQNEQNVLINPTKILIRTDTANEANIFDGIILGILYDVLTQNQILNVQIIDKKSSTEPIGLGMIQITVDLATHTFEKFEKILFEINETSLKFF